MRNKKNTGIQVNTVLNIADKNTFNIHTTAEYGIFFFFYKNLMCKEEMKHSFFPDVRPDEFVGERKFPLGCCFFSMPGE